MSIPCTSILDIGHPVGLYSECLACTSILDIGHSRSLYSECLPCLSVLDIPVGPTVNVYSVYIDIGYWSSSTFVQ